MQARWRGVGTQIKVFCCNNYIIVLSVCPNVTEFAIIFSLHSHRQWFTFIVYSVSFSIFLPFSLSLSAMSFVWAGVAADIAATIVCECKPTRENFCSCEYIYGSKQRSGSFRSLYLRAKVFKTVYVATHLRNV